MLLQKLLDDLFGLLWALYWLTFSSHSKCWGIIAIWIELIPDIKQFIVRQIKMRSEERRVGKEEKKRKVEQNGEVEVLEISRGKFSEEDIVRIKDKYGRA